MLRIVGRNSYNVEQHQRRGAFASFCEDFSPIFYLKERISGRSYPSIFRGAADASPAPERMLNLQRKRWQKWFGNRALADSKFDNTSEWLHNIIG